MQYNKIYNKLADLYKLPGHGRSKKDFRTLIFTHSWDRLASSMSEETIRSGIHERTPSSVQVNVAVKVRVEAGVLKVDYLMSKRITNNLSVSSRHPKHLSTACCGQAIPAQKAHTMVLRAGWTTNLQGESPVNQRLVQSHLKSRVLYPGGIVRVIWNISLYCTHTGDPTDSDKRRQNPVASY